MIFLLTCMILFLFDKKVLNEIWIKKVKYFLNKI
jgi:hypothetical protein